MRLRRFGWEGAAATAGAVRVWTLGAGAGVEVDIDPIDRDFRASESRDEYLLAMTRRHDAPEADSLRLRVAPEEIEDAVGTLDAELRSALEGAAANVRTVAEALVDREPRRVVLPQGQTVTMREVPVGAAGLYAPGGRAPYPSSVLMGAVPAQVAGVERIVLATPPRADGRVDRTVLAAAGLCGIEEVYAMGGAQAIFALAYGTETIGAVDVIAGPGNPWVTEAKARVSEVVGIDLLAGPSELMVVLDETADPAWAALDLCAQAEHGSESPLLAASTDASVLEAVEREVGRLAAERSGVGDAPLALVRVPALEDAVELANAFAPEHLELQAAGADRLAALVRTAGCVFAGSHSATAFGDYGAGSNHVLPTSGAGRFSGPLGPDAFRRRIATLEVPPEAASKLAPQVDRIAAAEGFLVHGESAMIRGEEADG
jgi:histidinol dehydrogenase